MAGENEEAYLHDMQEIACEMKEISDIMKKLTKSIDKLFFDVACKQKERENGSDNGDS